MTPASPLPAFALPAAELAAIDAVVAAFFAAFTNAGGRVPAGDDLRRVLAPGATITRCAGPSVERYDVEAFIAPRLALLTGGRLRDFEEREVWSRTDGFGGVASRLSVYAKHGVLDGVPFTARGVKVMQLVRTVDGWRLVAVAWEDEG